MAHFFKIFTMQGFDVHHSPHWQMVPKGGVRYVGLRGGAGLTVTSADTSICKVTEVRDADVPTKHRVVTLLTTDRAFRLDGVTHGHTLIKAAGGVGAVNLEVGVKNRKTIRITFNFVRDNASHATTRAPASAAGWVSAMNNIYTGQANIKILSRAARWVSVPKNLGSRIDTTKTGTGEEADLYPLGDSGADVNMFLVWDMDITDSADDDDAFTEGKRIVFEDNAGRQIGETMSHEVGHSQGLDDQYTVKRQLMYGYTDSRGIDLPKAHVNKINP
jgi:hypothetical protein